MTEKGKYIVLEGGEYVGKSTQARLLSESLGAKLVREPGGTLIGEAIRSVILDRNLPRAAQSDVLLHAAQRATLMGGVVYPTLLSGQSVVSDRSWISSAAYQGASGIDFEDIRRINEFAIGPLIKPDLLIVLDANPAEVAQRRTEEADYYESMDIDFHQRLRENFITISGLVGGFVVNALQDKDVITRQIREVVAQELGL